ncbi:MAG: lytic murein transglycosylase [Gammaproteobacteria bacterium]|nr:lytic murein transglycosylase [Gammaproteobacteria bacterium]
MKKLIKNPHLSLVAGLILAGCASDPAPDYSAYPTAMSYPQQTPLPSARPAPPPLPTQPYNPYRPSTPSYNTNNSYNDYGSSYGDSYGSSGNYGDRYEVRNFIRHMAEKHGFSESYLTGLFNQANRLDSVIRLEGPSSSNSGPARPGSWSRYRGKFLTEQHINNGVDFWRRNADAISKASSAYGVDPEYIVGIIGVETYFGKNIGKTCVFDALTTLSFDTHRRSKYFMSELENFLLMTREEGYNPRQPVGSWAGAMGLGQFMPSSFRKLAVDFDRNGQRDLWHPNDAIGSVAHYFSKNGWDYHSPVAQPAGGSYSPSVIELSTYEGTEYWQVHHNFKVIKRYNNSSKYAMAVHQLAQAIKNRYQGSQFTAN